jgi:hypothetical protein
MTDILAINLDKRNRHLERIVTYRNKHDQENVKDMTDIIKRPSLTVTDVVLKLHLSHCFVL